MDYGIKVSEPGYDVKTAEDKNLSLKSGLTLLKVFDSDRVTMSSSPTTVAHNLGYYPQFLVWTVFPNYPDYEGLTTVLLATGNFDAGAAWVNTSNLYIQPCMAQGNNSNATYYIFYEQLESSSVPTITPTADYGLKVSKDGVDVKTANILQQTLNSEKNSLKIAIEGTTTTSGSGDIDIPISHELDVIPGYILFFKVNSGKWYSTWEKEDVSGANVSVGAISETDNVYFQIRRNANCTVTVKYYIFVDSGN